ncbi:MAG: hypothetical protein FD166_385 [Bacteroidetes bacterium]|nr:MAG: hypothetical protein FD166_385 [Bacteroidota bacterium]
MGRGMNTNSGGIHLKMIANIGHLGVVPDGLDWSRLRSTIAARPPGGNAGQNCNGGRDQTRPQSN